MRELIEKYVGQAAEIKLSGLIIEVTIEDVKKSYNKIRYLVRPVAGKGAIWVESIY